MDRPVARKWLRVRRGLSYAVAVVATLALAAVIYTRSNVLSYQVTRYLNNHYFTRDGFEFSCGRISGNLFRRVVIENPALRFNGRRGSFNVFRANRITVDYNIVEVARLNFDADAVRVEGMRVRLRRDSDNRLVLPVSHAPRRRIPGRVSPRVHVKRFDIIGLSLVFGAHGKELAVRDVNLQGSMRYLNGEARVQIEKGGAYLLNSDKAVRAVRLDARERNGRVEVRDALVRLERSLVQATGAYEDGRIENLRAVFNPVSLDELVDLGIASNVDGEFGGNITANGTLDTLDVEGLVTGAGMGVALRGVRFQGKVTPSYAELASVRGELFGAPIDGSLRIRIKGPPDVHYRGRFSNVDLTHGFLPDKGIPPTNLSGRARIDHDAAAGTWDIDASLGRSIVDRYQMTSGTINGIYHDGRGLTVRHVTLNRPGYTIEGSGSVHDPGGIFDMVLRGRGHDLTYFWNYFKLPHVDGAVDVTARLTGPADDMRINLNGNVRGVEFLFAGIDSGSVQADLRHVGAPVPEVRMDISGSSGHIERARMFGPHLYLEANGGPVHVRSLTFTRGDTLYSTSFDATGNADSSVVRVTHAAVRTPTDTWALRRPAIITSNAGNVAVDSMVFVSPGGIIGGTGTVTGSGSQCDVHAWGRGTQLAVLRRALGLPIALEGLTSFELTAKGDLDAPLVRLSASVGTGQIDSVRFDNLSIRARFDGDGYTLDDLRLGRRDEALRASGQLAWHRSPLTMLRDGMQAGWKDAAVRVRFDATRLGVADVQRALHLPVRFGGGFSGTVQLAGSPTATTLEVDGMVRPSDSTGLMLPPTHMAVRISDEKLAIKSFSMRGDFAADLSGYLPANLSLVGGLRIARDRPLSLALVVHPSELARLRGYIPGVEQLRGRVAGRVTASGSVQNPVLAGAIDMSRAGGKLVNFEERLDNARARLEFAGSTIRLTKFAGKLGKDGHVDATGTCRLAGFVPDQYQVDFALRDIQVLSIPDFESIQSGNLRIASKRWSDGRLIPSITGKLAVHEATIKWAFGSTQATPSPIMMPTASPNWVCSIDLSADNNVWLRNPDLHVEMSGDVILNRDEQGLYLRGDLEVLRGSYNIYANKFTITDGTLNFSVVQTLRPEVHINAYTPYSNVGGIEKRIYLSLDWPQDRSEPTVSFSHDDPGYYETDLWRMLGGSSIAGGIAASALERAISQQMTGLSVEVEQRKLASSGTGNNREQEMVIGVGKYLWQDLYLKYRQGLSVSADQEVQVEYRISKLFLLRSEFIRNSRRGYIGRNGQYADEFNLDARFRWEY